MTESTANLARHLPGAQDRTPPIAYQRGWVEFYKLRFKVTPAVLIPRPETELLVEAAIKASPKTVLDLGTGSGNVAISIAKNIPDVRVVATDVSAEALKVAKQNAKLHGVAERIDFVVSDLLDKIDKKSHSRSNPESKILKRVQDDNPCFDLIVTNLPYIPSARIDYLDSSVKDYEPRVALDGGEDGFELYRQLFIQMVQKAWFPKYLIGEIDYTQAEVAINEALKYFPKCQPEVKFDLAHKQRFLVIKF